MAGQPRKPNHIKKAEGTLRADRVIENCAKYEPVNKLPEVNRDLNEDGKEWFRYRVQIMIDQGLMTTAFIADFENTAFIYQSMKEQQRNLTKDGYWITCPTGYKQVNPAWKMLIESMRTLKDFYQRYGLDLASSQKISVPPTDIDKLD